MEIFPYIARNFIQKLTGSRRKRTSRTCVLLSLMLSFILITGCQSITDGRSAQEASILTEVDAVAGYTPSTEDTEPASQESQIILTGVGAGTTQTEDEQILLRERNRTESESRYLYSRTFCASAYEHIVFDLNCKANVSESKVRQGIFHFRLQSNDEEAPLPAEAGDGMQSLFYC